MAVEYRHVLGFDAPELATKSTSIDEHFVEEEFSCASKLELRGCVVANRDLLDVHASARGLRDFDIGIDSQVAVEQTLTDCRDRPRN